MNRQNTIDLFMAKKGDWFPSESIGQIRQKMNDLDEERLMMVTAIEYKDPTIMLIISIFIGELGIDRFLLGQTMYGVLKLITGGGCLVWWLIDIFKIQSMTKEANYQRFISLVR